MNRNLEFNQLSPAQKLEARRALRQEHARILVGLEEAPDGTTTYQLQMEVVEARAHRILNHRLLLCTYAPECPILGKRVYLHRASFLGQAPIPDPGTFEVLSFSEELLWRMSRTIAGVLRRDVQILLAMPQVEQALAIPGIKPYLPKKLQDLDLVSLKLKEDLPVSIPRRPGRHALVEGQG